MTRIGMTRIGVLLAVVMSGVLGLFIGGIAAPPLRLSAATVAPQATLGSGFTYQGYLTQNGAPLNGTQLCDGQFELWDAASAGAQLGTTQTVTTIDFTNGYFTVTLNGANEFGTAPFAGAARWLAIALRCPAGTGAFTSLGRQALTAAPYATYAGNGVPSGTLILSDSMTPANGYTYTGQQVVTDGGWVQKAPLPTARYGLSSAVINNKIYAIGGKNSSIPLATVESYDPTTNTWTAQAPLSVPRIYPGVATLNNKIYAIGGYNGSTWLSIVEEYDPILNTWTTKAPMLTPRYGLVAAVVNNKIYTIGGWNGSSYVATVDEYDPTTDTWVARASMPTARGYAAATVINNAIYVIGGHNGISLAVTEKYDPSTNNWTTQAPMPTPRHALTATLINNTIYAFGGYNVSSSSYFTTIEVYDPATNTWTTRAPMPRARTEMTTAIVNNKSYIIGGTNGPVLAIVEEYQPLTLYLHRKN